MFVCHGAVAGFAMDEDDFGIVVSGVDLRSEGEEASSEYQKKKDGVSLLFHGAKV